MTEIRRGTPADIPGIAAIYDRILAEEEAGRASVGWVRGVYPTEASALEALEAGELFVMAEEGVLTAAVRPGAGVRLPADGYQREKRLRPGPVRPPGLPGGRDCPLRVQRHPRGGAGVPGEEIVGDDPLAVPALRERRPLKKTSPSPCRPGEGLFML